MSRHEPPLPTDRAHALALTPVPPATQARLDRFVALLLQWQRTVPLVAASTLPHLWTRHVADSLQLVPLAPAARIWVDFGSGGGFPGIPVACALADERATMVHLVESNARKAAFLREAVRTLGLPARIHMIRAENFGDTWRGPVDAVTARALAPLKTLLDQAFPLISRGAVGLFPKGQDVETELTEATKYWTITADLVTSKTNPSGRIVYVRRVEPKQRRVLPAGAAAPGKSPS
ncbi:MAG: 16S rRNA (guanine(527)-N(7))-methyltransferase RsmG [Pseudolabrys sp.]|nr:16S rRNA (guanine(527)-N(7))-methyltransferase RsmG [Pseudolabrys sp.]